MKKNIDCSCPKCQSACSYCPGWFLPGQVEKVAEHLNMTLKELFDKYLGVNWWEGEVPIFVLAPATTKMSAGSEYPGDPRGKCIFYKDGKCEIHPVKPYECRKAIHGDTQEVVQERHRFISKKWNKEQYRKQIVELLGREPKTKEYSFFDLLCGSSFSEEPIEGMNNCE